jgi:metal-responsive CopG/Arc/MetJ family transcriptional regulator
MQQTQASNQRTRTTVAIAPALLDAVDRAVREGLAASRNDFLAAALRRELARCNRQAIDDAFAAMADDPDYQQEAMDIEQSFAVASWEALATSARTPPLEAIRYE